MWAKLGENGLNGVGIPEEYGGQGGGIMEQVILDEELSRTFAGLYWLLGITLFDGKAIAQSGTEEQKQRFLPELAAGNLMCAISLTEPGGGTDVLGAMKTRGEEGRWRLGGQRHQDLVDTRPRRRPAVPGRTDQLPTSSAPPTASRCSSVTPRPRASRRPRFRSSACVRWAAARSSSTTCSSPTPTCSARSTRAGACSPPTLNCERIMNGANCTGALAGVLEDMVAYAKERTVFGKPLGQMQAVQHFIADTFVGLETTRLLTYRAAWLQRQDRPCGIESTMAKLVASEQCFAGADRGMQVLGGYGTRWSTTCSATGATCGSTGSRRSTTRWRATSWRRASAFPDPSSTSTAAASRRLLRGSEM